MFLAPTGSYHEGGQCYCYIFSMVLVVNSEH